jgi:hypothetical protein
VKHAALSFPSVVFPLTLLLAGIVGAQSAPARKDIPTIVKASDGAIVIIVIKTPNEKVTIIGTGFIVTGDGLIVTNFHVIEHGSGGIVKFPDGSALPIDGVVVADKVRDLAIIKIHGKAFKTLALGNSDRIQIGEEVVAIGNPLGLGLTVSSGILSGIRTDMEEGGKLLQTTAPISRGNSGGPLINMFGEVVGINVAYREGGQNLNFAIPVNDAKLLLEHRPAVLRDLPNEPLPVEEESPGERHGEAAPSQQKACDEQAEKFVRNDRLGFEVSAEIGYANHYDPKTNKCYVEISTDFGGGKKYPIGKTTGVYYTGKNYTIQDAFSEGEGGLLYGKFNFHREDITVQGGECHIYSLGYTYETRNSPDIRCRSEQEFNDLALKYFGTTTPIPPAYLKDVSAPLVVITYMYDAAKRGLSEGKGSIVDPDKFREITSNLWDQLPKLYKSAFVTVLMRVESTPPPWPDANETFNLVEAEVQKKADSEPLVLVYDYMFECAKREHSDGKTPNPEVLLETVNKFWSQQNSEYKAAWKDVLIKVESTKPPWPPLSEVTRMVDEQVKRNHRGTP